MDTSIVCNERPEEEEGEQEIERKQTRERRLEIIAGGASYYFCKTSKLAIT